MSADLEVVVDASPQGSLAWLRVGRARLAARRWPGVAAGRRAVVRIDPRDVVLCLGHPGPTSARNVLPGHVRSIRHVPEGVHVTLDVGFPLVALVTRQALEDLGLRRGSALFALVKATAIRPQVAFRARVGLELRGARGTLGARGLEFLRIIARTGSLSEAARSQGVTYRTAWARTRLMNRAWGSPLIARVKGGRGGGGTALTPEGEAALDLAESAQRILEEQLPVPPDPPAAHTRRIRRKPAK